MVSKSPKALSRVVPLLNGLNDLYLGATNLLSGMTLPYPSYLPLFMEFGSDLCVPNVG